MKANEIKPSGGRVNPGLNRMATGNPGPALEYAVRTGNITVVVDELDQACTATKCPRALQILAHYNRHYNVALIGGIRRAANIPTDLRANVRTVFLGRLNLPADADEIRKWFGRNVADETTLLPRGRFIRADLDTGMFREVEVPQ